MNKTELIDAIAQEAGLSKADAKKALEAFLATVEKTLKKGDKMTDVLISFLVIVIFLGATYGLYVSLLRLGKSFFPEATKKLIKLLESIF